MTTTATAIAARLRQDAAAKLETAESEWRAALLVGIDSSKPRRTVERAKGAFAEAEQRLKQAQSADAEATQAAIRDRTEALQGPLLADATAQVDSVVAAHPIPESPSEEPNMDAPMLHAATYRASYTRAKADAALDTHAEALAAVQKAQDAIDMRTKRRAEIVQRAATRESPDPADVAELALVDAELAALRPVLSAAQADAAKLDPAPLLREADAARAEVTRTIATAQHEALREQVRRHEAALIRAVAALRQAGVVAHTHTSLNQDWLPGEQLRMLVTHLRLPINITEVKNVPTGTVGESQGQTAQLG